MSFKTNLLGIPFSGTILVTAGKGAALLPQAGLQASEYIVDTGRQLLTVSSGRGVTSGTQPETIPLHREEGRGHFALAADVSEALFTGRTAAEVAVPLGFFLLGLSARHLYRKLTFSPPPPQVGSTPPPRGSTPPLRWSSTPPPGPLQLPRVKLRGLPAAERDFWKSYLTPTALKLTPGAYVDNAKEGARYARRLQKQLLSFLAQRPQLSDGFFRVFGELAEGYLSMQPVFGRHVEDASCANVFHQLRTLIGDPRVLADARIDPVLERLADLPSGAPVDFGMYVREGRFGNRELHPHVTTGFLSTADRLTANPKLWQNEVGSKLMSSIAEALRYMAVSNPEKTRELRVRMLNHVPEQFQDSPMALHLLTTFTTREDEQALKEIAAEDSPHPPQAKLAARAILDGFYVDETELRLSI